MIAVTMPKMFYREPTFHLACSSIIFGLGAIFVVFIDLSAPIVAFYRLFLGGLIFGALLMLRREPITISKPAFVYASLSGIFLGIDLSLWNASIFYIGPGIATILNSLQVFFMAAFGIILYKNKPSMRLWLSLLLTFTGVVLLCSNEVKQSDDGLLGVVVGILSGLAFAFSMLFLKETAKFQKHSVINTMLYASLAGALATGLYGLVMNENFIAGDIQSWLMVIIYGSIVHVLAWFLMAHSMPYLGIAVIGLLMSLEPVVVGFIDIFLLDKAATVIQIAGALLTISAIYLGSQTGAKSKTKNSHL